MIWYVDPVSGNNSYSGDSRTLLKTEVGSAGVTGGSISSYTLTVRTAGLNALARTNLLANSDELDKTDVWELGANCYWMETSTAYGHPLTGTQSSVFSLTTTSGVIQRVSFTPSVQYTFSAYVRVPSTPCNIRLGSYDGGATSLPAFQGYQISTPFAVTTSWQRISYTFTVGSSATYGILIIYGDANVGSVACLSCVQLERGASATAYVETNGWQTISINSNKVYAISDIVNDTTAKLRILNGGDALANCTDSTYYIGGPLLNFQGLNNARHNAGDHIRVKSSPAPTAVAATTGTWTNCPDAGPVAAKTLGTNSSVNGTFTLTAHGYVTDDVVYIAGHTTVTAANGVWLLQRINDNSFTLTDGDGVVPTLTGTGSAGTIALINHRAVRLNTAVTKAIHKCETAWTNGTTLNTTTNTYKMGLGSVSVAIAAGTGKKAYHTLASTLNLSGYTGVSFWFRTSAIIADGTTLSLRLCTDTIGDTSVHTIPIKIVDMAGTTLGISFINQNVPLSFDTGGVMNSGINSIAIYADTSWAGTILLDNIIACNGVTLQSLIGKPTSHGATSDPGWTLATQDTWWPIQSIDGRVILIDAGISYNVTNTRGYYGASGTVDLWKRETYKITPSATNAVANLQTTWLTTENGTYLKRTNIYGGWNFTSDTQDDITYFDGLNGFAYLLNSTYYASNWNYSRMGFVRGYSVGPFYSLVNSFSQCSWTMMNSWSVTAGSTGTAEFTDCFFATTFGISCNGSVLRSKFLGCIYRSTPYGMESIYTGTLFANCVYGFYLLTGSGFKAYNCTFKANGSDIYADATSSSPICSNCTFLSSSPFTLGQPTGTTLSVEDHRVYSHNHNGITGYSYIPCSYGRIEGLNGEWKMYVTSTSATYNKPLRFKLATIAVTANRAVTVTANLKRSMSGYFNLSLVCPAGQVEGITEQIATAHGTGVYIPYCEALNSWTVAGAATVTTNDTTAPNGETTAEKVEGVVTGTGVYITSIVPMNPGDRFEPSIYIKRISTSGVLRLVHSSGEAYGVWKINMSGLGDGWERITRTHSAVDVASRVDFVSNTTGTVNIYLSGQVATPALSFYAWGAQVDIGTSSSLYHNIYQPATITFTPTDDGVVDIYAYASTKVITTGIGYINNIVISGATRINETWDMTKVKDAQPLIANVGPAERVGIL